MALAEAGLMVDVLFGRGPSGQMEYQVVLRDRSNPQAITGMFWVSEATMEELSSKYADVKKVLDDARAGRISNRSKELERERRAKRKR